MAKPVKRLADEMQALKSTSIEELQEQADEIDYLTPREFAKLMNCHAQQVYTWIRKGVLEAERCKCGRTVVCVSKSKATLEKKARELGRFVRPEDDPRLSSSTSEETSLETSEEIVRGGMDTDSSSELRVQG